MNTNQTVIATSALSAGTTITGAGLVAGNVTATYANAKQSPRYPDSWKTYRVRSNPMYGGENEVAESPVTGKQIWVGDIAVGNTHGRFHYDLFCKLYPDVKSEVIAVCQSNVGTHSNVVFFSEADWSQFNNWVADRETLFGGRENLYSYSLPPLPIQLEASFNLPRMDDEGIVAIAAWLTEHCKGAVYQSGDHYVFTNADDAFLYKLKYSGAKGPLT